MTFSLPDSLTLAIPHVLVQTGAAPQDVRIGWMRSVNDIQQAFLNAVLALTGQRIRTLPLVRVSV